MQVITKVIDWPLRQAFTIARETFTSIECIQVTLTDAQGRQGRGEAVGVDYAGLGSDFDGVGCVPEGLDSVEKWPNLTRALIEEGYTAAEIRQIYGGNTLRLMSAVERAAAPRR